ncbi:hypothetical protein PG994_006079 [Apiospora phragmitis]|uniref:Uncharacterized protein n=1 Tax=Apiospora phragmitis TaxID=2905665 RepID=A0ABR1VE14_9PEZI
MLSVRQILRASTRSTIPNAATLQRTSRSALRAPFRLASTTVGGTSTDLKSEKSNPAQVQKPDDNRQAKNAASGQQSSQASKESNQQNTSGNGDNARSGKGKH